MATAKSAATIKRLENRKASLIAQVRYVYRQIVWLQHECRAYEDFITQRELWDAFHAWSDTRDNKGGV